jgi:mono/diheme cytochrome c family protein
VPSGAVVNQTCKVTMAKSEPRVMSAGVVVGISVMLMLAATAGIPTDAYAVGSYYTDAQAQAGRTVFSVQCSICHGDALEGKAGPALAGAQFLSVSQYQQLNADYLYRFMSKHMPANAPGSLSEAQYLDALAYILKVNGYPSGAEPLTADDKRLAQIKIEPTGAPRHIKP